MLGLSQDALAARIGYTDDTIRKIEADGRRPAHEVAMRLADCLEILTHERTAFIAFARGLASIDQAEGGGDRDPQAPWRRRKQPPTNLPNSLTRLLGRDRERELLCRHLEGATRLLTLTGPPGVGKTRLALQVGTDLRHAFAHGVFFVRLALVPSPALLPTAVLTALGIMPRPGESLTDILINYLRDKQLLLLLDNCEHLLVGTTLISELLQQCAALRVLATSRELLRLYGEQRVAVPPLALPPTDHFRPDELLDYAAVALFVERAQAMQFDFTLDQTNTPAVIGICRQLDALPLAIELAAALVGDRTPSEILAGLESRLGLLVDGARDVPARHQTLEKAIAWSYNLLTVAEQQLFQRFGVFAGGAPSAAVQAICIGVGEDKTEATALLETLVSKHLLEKEQTADGGVRYSLLETLREYAVAQLAASAEEAEIRHRHLAYFARLAEAAAPQIIGPEQVMWMDRLETEHNNLRAALSWAPAHDTEQGLRIGSALGEFWRRRGHWAEGQQWLETLLAGPTPDLQLRAHALGAAEGLAVILGDYGAATRLVEESLALYRQLGDQNGVAGAVRELASMAMAAGKLTEALTLATQSLDLARATGDRRTLAAALFRLGDVVARQGNLLQARAYFRECLILLREFGDWRPMAMTNNNLGLLAAQQGQPEEAQHYYEEGLQLWREIGDREGMSITLGNLGDLALEQQDYTRAEELFQQASALQRELGAPGRFAGSLAALGDVARAQHDYARARQYYEESLELCHRWNPNEADGVLRSLGLLALDEAHPAQAALLLRESLTLCPDWNPPYHLAPVLAGLGAVAGAAGLLEHAAQLFGAAQEILTRSGVRYMPWDGTMFAQYEAKVRAALSLVAWETAYRKGLMMTVEQARACALDESFIG